MVEAIPAVKAASVLKGKEEEGKRDVQFEYWRKVESEEAWMKIPFPDLLSESVQFSKVTDEKVREVLNELPLM